MKRLDSMGEASIEDGTKFRVNVFSSPKEKTITFEDNGIGMTTEEVEKYINQIAFSGATDFLEKYKGVKALPDATINTESPAWAIDRLSILALKIYHMNAEVERTDASAEHLQKCKAKLDVLTEQQKDLSSAIDQLLADIESGRKYMKVYRQMKMYNDPALNPVLYGNKK
jgi:hypothetical protein